jgi:hypothetical protein
MERARCLRCGTHNEYPTRACYLTYLSCWLCLRDLRPVGDLGAALPPLPERDAVRVLHAEYGVFDGSAPPLDCTERVRSRAESTGGRFLSVSPSEDLAVLGGGDPAPGVPKELRVRLSIRERVLERTVAALLQENAARLAEPLFVSAADWTPSVRDTLYPSVSEPVSLSSEAPPLPPEDALWPSLDGLDIVAATLGHPRRPEVSVDITDALRAKVQQVEEGDVLEIAAGGSALARIVGADPWPGRRKMLRVRYMVRGRQAMASRWVEPGEGREARAHYERLGGARAPTAATEAEGAEEDADAASAPYHLARGLRLCAPRRVPSLWIDCATWGHPASASAAFDVTLALQSRCFESATPGFPATEGRLWEVAVEEEEEGEGKVGSAETPSLPASSPLPASSSPPPTPAPAPAPSSPTASVEPRMREVLRRLGEALRGGGDGSAGERAAWEWARRASAEKGSGEWLLVRADEDLHDLFGDPYKTASKSLLVWWRFERRLRAQRVFVRFGEVSDRVRIAAPVVDPALAVERAILVLGRSGASVDVTRALRRQLEAHRRLSIAAGVPLLAALALPADADARAGSSATRGGAGDEALAAAASPARAAYFGLRSPEEVEALRARREERGRLARFGAADMRALRTPDKHGDEGAAVRRLAGPGSGKTTHRLQVAFSGHGVGGVASLLADADTGLVLEGAALDVVSTATPCPPPRVIRALLLPEYIAHSDAPAAPCPDVVLHGDEDPALVRFLVPAATGAPSFAVNVAERLRAALQDTPHGLLFDLPARAPLEAHLAPAAAQGRRVDAAVAPGEALVLHMLWENPRAHGCLQVKGQVPGPLGTDLRIGWVPDSEYLRFAALDRVRY